MLKGFQSPHIKSCSFCLNRRILLVNCMKFNMIIFSPSMPIPEDSSYIVINDWFLIVSRSIYHFKMYIISQLSLLSYSRINTLSLSLPSVLTLNGKKYLTFLWNQRYEMNNNASNYNDLVEITLLILPRRIP